MAITFRRRIILRSRFASDSIPRRDRLSSVNLGCELTDEKPCPCLRRELATLRTCSLTRGLPPACPA